MKALLKCYYGYQNRGDELLFFGVIAYVFDHDGDLTHLDVEVGDVNWMSQWCEFNHDLRQPYKSRVRFIPSRTFSMWIADYDMIYLGGGEVLASQTRSFGHGGVNYLALFWRWIYSGRVVWLGGIETPSVRWSKLLYRMMLPHAQQIVCREQGSYEIAKRYTDQVVLYHDWAIDVLEEVKVGSKWVQSGFKVGEQYILINFIPKHISPEIITQFHEWIQDYPDHQIINFPAEQGDTLPDEIVEKYEDRIQTRQRWDPDATGTGHAISDTLALFQQADAGFGQRLHFIIPCVYYRIPIFRLSYSEKVDKILQYFVSKEL